MHRDVKFKIDEARFFLQKMKENFENDPDKRFYLSGFLSSARSIDYYLCALYGKKDGFKEWRENKKKELSIDTHVKELIDMRTVSVHKRAVGTTTEATARLANIVVPVKAGEEFPFIPMLSQDSMSTVRLSGSPNPKIERWMFNENFEFDVIPFCERELENVINAAKEAFEKFN